MEENKMVPQQEETGEFGKLFRTAFRGFHKQDVIECIARLTRDKNREKEADEIRIRELDDRCAQLTEELNAARKINADLTAQLYQARADREAAQAELVQEKASIERRIQQKTEALTLDTAQKSEKIDVLTRQRDTAQQLFAAMSAQNRLITAQKEAALLAAKYFYTHKDAAPVVPVPEKPNVQPHPVRPENAPRTGAAAAQMIAENTQKKLIKGVNSLLSRILND